jgi:excisionase family DNA binding protein
MLGFGVSGKNLKPETNLGQIIADDQVGPCENAQHGSRGATPTIRGPPCRSGNWQSRCLRLLMSNAQHSTRLPRLVGAAVIAESINWSRKQVYDLAQKGLIPHYRIEGSVRFSEDEIADWLQRHRIAA